MRAIQTSLIVAAIVAAHAATSAAQAGYSNPVLPGDYPDPSIVRVGSDYWATATTSQWAPIFPILHSRDLVNWTQSGAVFDTPPSWSAGSYWAPEISNDGSRFFVYYTARKKDGPLCVAVATALKAAGPYTDHGPLVILLGLLDHAARHQLIERLSHRHRRIVADDVEDGLADHGYLVRVAPC